GGDGVPGADPIDVAADRRERPAPRRARGARPRGVPWPRARAPATRRPRRLRRQAPARAVGRHAAARRALPGAAPRSAAALDGRALRRPRRDDARRAQSGVAARVGRGEPDAEDHRLRHPLDRGSGLSRRSGRRPDPAAGARRRARPGPAPAPAHGRDPGEPCLRCPRASDSPAARAFRVAWSRTRRGRGPSETRSFWALSRPDPKAQAFVMSASVVEEGLPAPRLPDLGYGGRADLAEADGEERVEERRRGDERGVGALPNEVLGALDGRDPTDGDHGP